MVRAAYPMLTRSRMQMKYISIHKRDDPPPDLPVERRFVDIRDMAVVVHGDLG